MARKSGLALWMRIPGRVWRILRSDKVTLKDKLIFVVPVLLYWVLPDFMPLLPIDDAAFTAAAAIWYARAMERKYGI
ncbi:hypothetical protein B1A99_01930 [Cohnella sp. CIP 111063]|mgnify:CR=1 FL=1|jgi:hypothetical protein|uniref:hypothetical protein n=1 Tax=unclassified Cohnella TaxID=2636738 RepID=UPI000B8C5A5C|nr:MULTISPECIES: hypothetical protein [unclassified Cohnella]OXS62639.1 hypothetical protein B1A99_01930 [Cohnella sp. CIP 111063]PRX74900.1 hypothetical protein B0G52_101396 [Cohnella sp. SGD-V74]